MKILLKTFLCLLHLCWIFTQELIKVTYSALFHYANISTMPLIFKTSVKVSNKLSKWLKDKRADKWFPIFEDFDPTKSLTVSSLLL